ncbi:hypothetical protein [Hyphomicrobium sp.]|uniref:hypothetical protein n=1 Tax=Hyphomicrobium sp. TaxID=82 RepID=UPI0025BEDE3F|nr:hypothetical protein [Hyphomicrobium sp.]MCC7251895.1 hypothetical protein [Hyphomicrobium sp.]
MATVVTVHGTFAHSGGTAEALNIGDGETQWWQHGSEFEADLKSKVAGAEGGPVEVVPFTWSSLNSEIDRRNAGSALLRVLRGLDARGEPYCVVGHSHGGSVIASALIESVAKRKPLTHLKRWITVGTPFVGMRKERFLFTRLTLTRKVIFVASLMLFMMFLFYMAGELFGQGFQRRGERFYTALLFSGTMMSLPMLFSYLVFRYLDGRELMGYGRGAVQRAQEHYADKWLPLCHKDDEAVHGLRYLPNVQMHFFEKDFAASTLTKAAIIALPLVYLFVVTSPTIMLAISDFLQTKVYDVHEFADEDAAVTKAREEMRSLNQRMREVRRQGERSGLDPLAADDARRKSDDIRRELAAKRRQLEQSFPQFAEAERAQRFKRRFLMRDRKPCEGNRLCGGGHDYALNSKLLFHVVTDELSSAVVDDEIFGGRVGGVLRLLIPVVLVPVAFALLALGALAVIEYLARIVSRWVSRVLNHVTLAEVKRSTFGNDTEGEVVVGADYGPSWLEPVTCLLPDEVSEAISAHSNQMAAQSIAKFRNAISTFAFAEGEESKSGLIAGYLSWKELVHTSYFDIPAFRKIVALSIGQAEGFAPTAAFLHDATFTRTAQWVADLGRKLDAVGVPTDIAVAGQQPVERPVAFPA